ncbi:MAG TPA: hypothetical protein VKU41_25280 [Polyangiaceae bacterium]|nr:hypothetical protein [Polyangiaceae bacterium]
MTPKAWQLPPMVAVCLLACDPSSTDAQAESPIGGAPAAPAAAPVLQEHLATFAGAGTGKTEVADVVRVDGDRLYFLSEDRGLVVFDVTDIDHPREVGASPIAGSPAGVFVRGDFALIAVADWDRQDGTVFHGSVLRSVDIATPGTSGIRAEVALSGIIRDVHVIGQTVFVLWERAGSGTADGPVAVLSAYRWSGDDLRETGEWTGRGADAALAVGATRVVVARRAPGVSAIDLTFADVGSETEPPLHQRGSLRFPGALPPGVEPQFAADDRHALVVVCRSTDCPAGSDVSIRVIDSQDADHPSPVADLTLADAGGPLLAVFDGKRLYLADKKGYAHGDEDSVVRVVDVSDPSRPRLETRIRVPGSVSSLVPIGAKVLAVGSGGTPETGVHVRVCEIDVASGKVETSPASVDFGEDWTSTTAAAAGALAVDEGERWLAVPFGTWRRDLRRYANGVELLRLTPRLARVRAAPATGWVERVLFLKGRFVAVSSAGLSIVDPDAVQASPKESSLSKSM